MISGERGGVLNLSVEVEGSVIRREGVRDGEWRMGEFVMGKIRRLGIRK